MISDAQVEVLEVVAGQLTGRRFPLDPSRDYVMGRGGEVDIQLKDDTVSRRHARVGRARGGFWLRDLGSRNGTLINGRRVDRHWLRPGDRIAVGSSLLKVVLAERKELESPPPPAPESSGRSMSGSLRDIPLADVLQWLSTSRKTGTLRVRGARTGELLLREGQVFFARIEGSPGISAQRALLRMMSWVEGTFGLDPTIDTSLAIAPSAEIETSLGAVLMEAARQQDELAHLASKHSLPSGDVALAFPSPKPWRELSPEELDIVEALAAGGHWPVLLDTLRSDDVTATKALLSLRKAGVLRDL